jgi:drug/metabolite transporter (DMT)-like permease
VVSAGVALLAAFTWAAGSLYAATAPMMSRGPIATAMQMLMGGFSLIAAGMATGEAAAFQSAHVTLSSLLALGYLAAFGSLVAFSAYSWLLQRVSPARLSTYAYVNPIIAVLVGWLIGHEGIDARTVGATVVIVGGVVLLSMVTHGVRRRGTDTGRSA